MIKVSKLGQSPLIENIAWIQSRLCVSTSRRFVDHDPSQHSWLDSLVVFDGLNFDESSLVRFQKPEASKTRFTNIYSFSEDQVIVVRESRGSASNYLYLYSCESGFEWEFECGFNDHAIGPPIALPDLRLAICTTHSIMVIDRQEKKVVHRFKYTGKDDDFGFDGMCVLGSQLIATEHEFDRARIFSWDLSNEKPERRLIREFNEIHLVVRRSHAFEHENSVAYFVEQPESRSIWLHQNNDWQHVELDVIEDFGYWSCQVGEKLFFLTGRHTLWSLHLGTHALREEHVFEDMILKQSFNSSTSTVAFLSIDRSVYAATLG